MARATIGLALAAAAAQRSLLIHPDTDPHADEDPFLALTPSELRRTWSHSSEDEQHAAGAGAAAAPSSLAGRMAAITELVDATYVDVRLVGFGGEGNLGVEIGEAELQRLLDAAPAVAAPHVVHPAPGEAHALPIRRRFVRAVTRAPASLAASISDAVSQAVHASGRAVPVAAVDALVREDCMRRSLTLTLTLSLSLSLSLSLNLSLTLTLALTLTLPLPLPLALTLTRTTCGGARRT